MNKQDIINLYQEGYSILQISKMQEDYSYRQINSILIENKIPIRGGRKKKELSPDQMEQLKKEYCENSVSLKELSEMFGIAKETIRRIIQENNFQKKTNNRVNKNINSDYFSVIDSEEKAYWLGFFLADGSVDQECPNTETRIRICLQSQDKYILEHLRETLRINSQLIYDSRGKGCYSLEFKDSKMAKDLAKYNIIPQKTYKVKNLPKNIPTEFLKDYLRGLFDGDGCLTYSSDMSVDVGLRFTSFSEELVKDIQETIDKLIHKENHNKLSYNGSWNCCWRGYSQVISILDILYSNSTIYLERKYKKYLKLKNR